ncbi:hypothetical protein JCM15519_29930 [Fundidesulfovibrio butyratiphilus]
MTKLTIGQPVPDFRLPAALPGGEVRELSPAAFAGKWLVLYVYPRDNTPGCTVENQEFSALAKDFEALGAAVVGMSKDSIKSHQGFQDKKDLSVPLVSDLKTETLDAYGAWGEKKVRGKVGMGTIRSTVLVDPNGVVARHWPQAKSKGHAAEVLEALKELAG